MIRKNRPIVEFPGDNVELSCFKREKNRIIIRFYETLGKHGTTICRLPDIIKKCIRCDATGRDICNQKVNGREINIKLKPFEIITLKVFL